MYLSTLVKLKSKIVSYGNLRLTSSWLFCAVREVFLAACTSIKVSTDR